MASSSLMWAKAFMYSSLAFGLVHGQTSAQTSSSQADGLSTHMTTSASATVGTATVNGSPTTYSVQFTVPASADEGPNELPNIYDPQAKNAQLLCPGYTASNAVRNEFGFSATLKLAGKPCNVYGTDIETLSLTVDVQTAHRLAVNIMPAYIGSSNHSEYILPAELVHLPVQGVADAATQDIDLQFSWSNDPTFSFTVLRKSTGDVLFSTKDTILVYENQFWEFVTALPDNYNLYGMGERIHGFRLGNNFTTTFWAADAGDPVDGNIYGNHPFYLDTRYYEQDASGNLTYVANATSSEGNYVSHSHGVYLRNAHGMEAIMNPSNLTWRGIGGAIELYFFDGPTQPEVTKQYLIGAVGLPAMQQYFTFGYHQCRWGYKNWTMMEDVVRTFREFDIPLENIWTDIDYMFQYRDFTNDPNTFSYEQAATFLANLTANHQHYIPIVDSAIYIPNPNNASDNYSVYTNGHEMDVFLKNPDGSEYIGSVWPGYTVYPDWHNGKAFTWWTESMAGWHDKVNFSGIWIDMSEVSSFCVGSCGSGNLSLNPVHPFFSLPGETGAIVFDYPEDFNITNSTEAAAASSSSAAQSASAASANPPSTATTPYYRSSVTPNARNVIDPPYVLNNVNGALGVHAVSPNATHVDGTQEYDVHNLFGHQILNATYQALLSIFPGKRPFIIGRSTFAGSGIWAGHWGGDNASKWYYMYFSIPQALNFGLFVWASVAAATKSAISIRYSLLPYMYTLFYYAHTTGSTVMRALSWEFPNDPSLADADRQFLLGPSLMICPVLAPLATTVGCVFPGVAQGEVWYDWYSQSAMDVQAGENATIDAPLGTFTHPLQLFVRGGSILPQQEALYTTFESRNSSWSLLAALDMEDSATGTVYIDDGESLVQKSTLLVDLTISENSLYASARGVYPDTNPLANVTVMGVMAEPSSVTLNGVKISSGVAYNSTSKCLKVTGLGSATSAGAWAGDWTLSWA
ncbi:hypothetical protein LTR28_003379 [Elasticomyces elasticus]|nr:hypothetical protein LTR28_003379 [Elasticomyces elasticus]